MGRARRAQVAAVAVAVAVGFAVAAPALRAAPETFIEEFTSTARRDPTTTATWDTAMGVVRLRASLSEWATLVGLNGRNVTAAVFSPAFATDRTAFAGTTDGILRTTDGGVSWAPVANTAEVANIALSPAFATDRRGFAITNGAGLYHTTDGGATWHGVRMTSGFRVAFSPAFSADRTVFAAGVTGILRSTDAGATWTLVAEGMDADALANGDIRGMAISESYATDRTVYATTLSAGVYRSTDGGETWVNVTPAQVDLPTAAAIDAGPKGVVAAALFDGAYVSTDAGAMWTRMVTGEVSDIAVSPSYGSDQTVFLATASGPLRWSSGSGTRDVTSGWSRGAATTIVVTSVAASRSVLAGHASGALLARTLYPAQAVAASTVVADVATPILRATLTPTANLPNDTAITYEVSAGDGADGKPVWEGPVTPDAPWTFRTIGSALRWRATFTTSNPAATPVLDRLAIAYEASAEPAPLTPPTPAGSTVNDEEVRWRFTETAADATGYEIHAGSHGTPGERVVATTQPKIVPHATSLVEGTLAPNTEYCDRHAHALRGAATSPPSAAFACATTLAEKPPVPTASDIGATGATLVLRTGGNPADTEFAIQETASEGYVAVDGALWQRDPVWRTAAVWGGSTRISGLTPGTAYTFCARARNRAGAITGCSATVRVQTLAAAAERGVLTLSVRAAISGAAVAGAEIPWVLTVENTGRAAATDIVITAPIPAGTTYVNGSLTTAKQRLTESRDGDTGDVNISTRDAVTFRIEELPVEAKMVFGFRTRVRDDAGTIVELSASAVYRPLRDAAAIRSDTASVRVEVTPAARPTLTITIPSDGADIVFGDPTVVRGLAPAGATVAIALDGENQTEVQADAGGAFTANIGVLPDGDHTIRARVVGAVATEAVARVRVRAGTPEDGGEPKPSGPGVPGEEPPEITIALASPSDGEVLDGTDLTVVGTATPGITVELSVDGEPRALVAVGSDGAFSRTFANLAPGDHLITVRAGTAVAAARVTVPLPPELVTITAPRDGEFLNTPAVRISGRGPARARLAIAVDAARVGEAVSDAAGNFAFVAVGALAEGAHAVTVSAPSGGGTSVAATVTFTFDTTPPPAPEILELAVTERTIARSTPGAFDVTLTLTGAVPDDGFAELDALLITVASEPRTFTVVPDAPEWVHRITVPLAPGSHTVRIASRDRAGNVSPAAEASFTVQPAACGNGADDDGDGRVDFPADPDCEEARDDDEATPAALVRAAKVIGTTTARAAGAVATGTTRAARATAKAAERTTRVVQERVLDNPTVETAAERVVAPAVAVAVVANTATVARGFQLTAYLQYLIGLLLQPGRLFGRRKRKGWGTVYDSATKRPVDLATVRLVEAGSGTVRQSAVTDTLGRYAFIVRKPGTYRLTVAHPRYAFPSERLAKRSEDAAFIDLYHGAPITVTEAGASLTANIPVDPKEERPEAHDVTVRRHYLRLLSNGVSNGGLVLSVVSFGITPRPLVGAFLALNILLSIFFHRIARSAKRPKSWGVVRDAATGQPIHLAIVRIFDTQYHKLLETAVTDRYGRYRFLVGRNIYELTTEKTGYVPARIADLDLTKREGVVGVDLRLKPIGR